MFGPPNAQCIIPVIEMGERERETRADSQSLSHSFHHHPTRSYPAITREGRIRALRPRNLSFSLLTSRDYPSNSNLPSRRSSTAIRTPLSKALASAAVWKVSPNFWSPVRQWWNVGMTLLYWKSFRMVQLRTTYPFKKLSSSVFFKRGPDKGVWAVRNPLIRSLTV